MQTMPGRGPKEYESRPGETSQLFSWIGPKTSDQRNKLAPGVGVEPTTHGLTVRCSAN